MSTVERTATGARRRPRTTTIVGAALLAVLVLAALAAPLLAPHDPEAVQSARVLGSPSASYPFGSDVLGRDVLSRVLYALRVS